jgi:hypothetical protein
MPVVAVTDYRHFGDKPYYITADGIGALHAMVLYARVALAEMNEPQPTAVEVFTWSKSRRDREYEWVERAGLTLSMLTRYEEAHDWDDTYRLFENNAEAPVVPFFDSGWSCLQRRADPHSAESRRSIQFAAGKGSNYAVRLLGA